MLIRGYIRYHLAASLLLIIREYINITLTHYLHNGKMYNYIINSTKCTIEAYSINKNCMVYHWLFVPTSVCKTNTKFTKLKITLDT